MLRLYQIQAIDEIRSCYAKNIKKVLLKMPTGAGKTVIFSEVMKRLVAKNKRAIMATRGRHLVDQCHKRLLREFVPHGVLMSGHWNYNPKELIQICSVDTLRARKLFPQTDLIVLDEVHYATSPTYRDFIAAYPDTYILGVTATPFVEQSLRHVADVVVEPITMQGLIDQGYLVPAEYYAPVSVDLSGVKVSSSTKDYVVNDLESLLNNNQIIGDIVLNWKKFSEARPTLIFAVSIAHSKHIVEQFNQAGISAIHCDADTPDKERDRIISEFSQGKIKVISNVGIFCTGIDIPPLGCIIMARPTKSYNLYVQQLGRGTRPHEGKENFIVIDHAGNVLRHGFITEEKECNLDGKPAKEKETKVKICDTCFKAYNAFASKCPFCGSQKITIESQRIIESVQGTLEKLNSLPLTPYREYERLKKVKKENKFKRGWLYFQMRAKFGEEIASQYCPKIVVPDWVKQKNESW